MSPSGSARWPVVSSPRRGALGCGVSLAVTLVLQAALAGCGGAELPHIIVVSWDTVRRDHCSLYGYERETTPFLEELARESVVYENAYTTASFTLTAHMSIFTGLYPEQHGVDKRSALSPEIPMLAERLRERSYHTVGVVRGAWIDERFGFVRGFDVFESRLDAQQAGQTMREALRNRPRDRPLFLFVHVMDAHCQNLTVPTSTLYAPPPAYGDTFREGALERLREQPPGKVYRGEQPARPGEREDLVALYDASIRYLDDSLRAWMDTWEQEGLLDNALFLLTSDHGEALGQRDGKWVGHGNLWQEGLRVPLLVRHPDGRGAGTRDQRLTSAVDLLPTILELLSIPAEPWLQGRSLGTPRAPGEVILAEGSNHWMITDGRIKTRSSKGGAKPFAFDLEQDPLELEPLEGQAMETIRSRLEERTHALRALAPPGQPLPAASPTQATRAELDALGYGGHSED